MSVVNDHSKESLETWLAQKPFWEQYVWHVNLQKETLTPSDLDQCFQYLSEHLGIGPTQINKPSISFQELIPAAESISESSKRVSLVEIKDFHGVNAISKDCSLKIGSHLTLAYGMNGSGKSGIARLLCKACSSRGEREILPNVKEAQVKDLKISANFVLKDDLGEIAYFTYLDGLSHKSLKRFCVFDAQSVHIHLDERNSISFVPAQIRIFDKVAETVGQLERMLDAEKSKRRKGDPFAAMFLDPNEMYATANFCKFLTWKTTDEAFLLHANFDADKDEQLLKTLRAQIDEKRKLDIPKKRSQLLADKESITALKAQLQAKLDIFTIENVEAINAISHQIEQGNLLVKHLSVQNFNDGVLKTLGSVEWRSLVSAAKILLDHEKAANEGNEPTHCMLCHQWLGDKERTLFEKYWEFLEGKAESELAKNKEKQRVILEKLSDAKKTFPQFLPTDAGIRLLTDEEPEFLKVLKDQFSSVYSTIDSWIIEIRESQNIDAKTMPTVELSKLETMAKAKSDADIALVDPTSEIKKLERQLVELTHKKLVTNVKQAALDYLAWLRWQAYAESVSFPGIKGATTKKRTDAFLVGVASNYIEIFNRELAELGCSFGLSLHVSGDQGSTVKEYKFDFAEAYSPTQILSEGEQNACALADFLTEIQIDKNNCGIAFDDPVTSLDHERKEKIAIRLVREAEYRQVIILTHDIVFMSLLVKHAGEETPFIAHWIRNVNGVPGVIEDNTSPKLASLQKLKADSQNALQGIESMTGKQQEHALGVAFDYLRSACEALIEEKLFAKTIQRYEDHIKVQNLEEAIFRQDIALKIVGLHGRISEMVLAHNRSDLQRGEPLGLANYKSVRKKFDDLEAELKQSAREAKEARKDRRDSSAVEKSGW